MSFIADAHREWHVVYGSQAVCPLDCGANEGAMAEAADEYEAQEERQARREAARAEAIATGRTVKV